MSISNKQLTNLSIIRNIQYVSKMLYFIEILLVLGLILSNITGLKLTVTSVCSSQTVVTYL